MRMVGFFVPKNSQVLSDFVDAYDVMLEMEQEKALQEKAGGFWQQKTGWW